MKEIPLTRGLKALVDDSDYERLMCWKWCVRVKPGQRWSGRPYFSVYRNAYSGIGRSRVRVRIPLANEVLRLPHGVMVDHRDHDPLNNRKRNLRIATAQLNSANSIRCNPLGYRGVKARAGKFEAVITVDRRLIYLGTYLAIEDAAAAYDNAAREFWGQFAVLNFPGEQRLPRKESVKNRFYCWRGGGKGSGFRGVYWHVKRRKWRVYVGHAKRQIYVGLFDDVMIAARAYDREAKRLHGRFALLNFPD